MDTYNKNVILAVDPGLKGGIAVLNHGQLTVHKMPDTFPEIFWLLKGIKEEYAPSPIVAVLEDVGKGVPGQSSKATATFARHNGHLEMALYALSIPTEKVTPNKWEKFYSNSVGKSTGLSKTEWKNKLKGLAQRLYPSEKVTLNTADAILLAHYGKSIGL
jgi:hypothetical protein